MAARHLVRSELFAGGAEHGQQHADEDGDDADDDQQFDEGKRAGRADAMGTPRAGGDP
jgi:hypothetical protein